MKGKKYKEKILLNCTSPEVYHELVEATGLGKPSLHFWRCVKWVFQTFRTGPRLFQWPSSKEFTCNAGATGDTGSIPGLGRSLGGGNGNSLQYSCLENPMDGGAWQATVQRVTKSWTRLKRRSTHRTGPSVYHVEYKISQHWICILKFPQSSNWVKLLNCCPWDEAHAVYWPQSLPLPIVPQILQPSTSCFWTLHGSAAAKVE